MPRLSDAAVKHLRTVAEQPDLTGTKYEVLGVLGRGGMGTVYVAMDHDLGRQVALKVLGAAVAPTGGFARLMREAQILARLEHPGIVPVHDVGRLPDGRTYYTMKRVRGRRLDQHVTSTTPLAERLQIFERICEAVGFAHAHGVIHRDLKPENVMVGSYGEVLVMDWGIAKIRDAGDVRRSASPSPSSVPAGQTAPGTVLGTPGYMAPEQAGGDPALVDERSDIYALGAILRFLLTGDVPGSGAEGLSRVEPPMPHALAAVCRKALGSRPDDRYQEVVLLAADVSRFREGLPVSAYPEGVVDRARRLARRYRLPLALVLAYLFMRLLLLLWAGG